MYTIIANDKIKQWLEVNLEKFKRNPSGKYTVQEYGDRRFNIILYTTNTLLISGELKDRIYNKVLEISGEQLYVGMDEVGVGDFFGPVIYVAVYMSDRTMNYLQNNPINIKDSKKLKNEDILKIYMKVKDNIDYVYEKVYDYEIENMRLNSIEQKMYFHNANYNELIDEEYNIKNLVIDLFTTENNFKKRTQEMDLQWNDVLTLETKADSKFICVALASMIARGIYLESIKEIEQKYNMNIPLGTNQQVIDVSKKILKEYSEEDLSKICKTTFKTYNEIINNL